MRRGHPGIGGWRNENPRHFRPRSGGTPHYRPTRGYGHADSLRFPPPGPRPFPGPSTYSNMPGNNHLPMPDNHDRNNFRGNRPNNHHRQDRGQRQIFPFLKKIRYGDVPDHSNSYSETPNYRDNNRNQRHMNNMGDIDHRQPPNLSNNREPPAYQRISPWVNPPFYEERSPQKQYTHQDNLEHNKNLQAEYPSAGHRPPASDHYGNKHGSTMDNSNTFSRSVDDTVNIVRKRLLSRESQNSSENTLITQGEVEKPRDPMTSSYPDIQQEQPIKKKSHSLQRQSRYVKSNCDKIKNKIVHQLFMMDKDKIHKLMDNPNSSSKFEYAISSLVTESQNSFNRHLRSVAEKSLCSSSTEFIHNDTNTIYEDTFMKQMQCLLDPQDTVLLEDIKPIVLAELSKVLQLDDFEQRNEAYEASQSRDDPSLFNQYQDESSNNENYQEYDPCSPINNHDNYYEQKSQSDYNRSKTPVWNENDINKTTNEYAPKPLYERRKTDRSCEYSHNRRSSSERQINERSSIGSKSEDNFRSVTPARMFDPDAERFSDEDDPFAELDNQYHVAVDPNFIENYENSSPQPEQSVTSNTSQSPVRNLEVSSKPNTPIKPPLNFKRLSQINIQSPEKPMHKIKEEIDSQLQDMAKSPLELLVNTIKNEQNRSDFIRSEQESLNGNVGTKLDTPTIRVENDENKAKNGVFVKQEHNTEPKGIEDAAEKSESTSTTNKSSTPTHSRKRSTDQRPSHRKEKRKKSESSQSDPHISNKSIIINISDCAANTCAPKSSSDVLSPKDKSSRDSSKESKKIDSERQKGYSDKYVKRKENSKKSKENSGKDSGSKKKHDSSSSSHSLLSPSDVSNTSLNQTPTKAEGQTKLKPIDMFGEQPRKQSSVHHTHRNTAPAPAANKVAVETKPVVLNRKITKRHIATQVLRKVLSKEVQTSESKCSSSRFCQTEKKRLITRGAQTEPINIRPTTKSKDAFRRMKEIDVEIQMLLQEKFQLYNSLESKESYASTMQSLGMAVLNMSSFDTNSSISEDTIVEEFTSIPVEELEQIALETVQEEKNAKARVEKRTRRQKVDECVAGPSRKRSISPATSTTSTRSKKNTKTPNISLIEQIITDDRPLEDIISLDDLETIPSRRSRRPLKTYQKKQQKAVKKTKVPKPDCKQNDLDIKECTVVLLRDDLNLLLQKIEACKGENLLPETTDAEITQSNVNEIVPSGESTQTAVDVQDTAESAIETDNETSQTEEPVNHIDFDLLDISEDIVIGDVCEIKCSEEKDASNTSTPTISEEIILDNSQSSIEDAAGPEAASEECKMYDYSADENLRRDSVTVTGNGDAILAIECIENNFLAASLDGNVYYFNNDGQLMNTLRGSNLPVTCLTIVKEKYGTTVYTGSLDSRIRYYDLETGLEKGPECNVLSPIQTMDRAWETIFVGTRTGFVLQFECKNNMLIPVSSVKFSEQSILSLRAMKEGPRKVLLVAARSEAVTIRDAQTGLLLRTLDGPKMTVYSLLFEDGKVFCGTSSHQIHVFDYASGSHVGSHEGGKGAVCLRATGGLVFAGCYDGCVYVFREGESRPLAQLRGPSLMLLSLALVGSKIIAGYKDRSLYIWKIPLSILQEMIL